MRTVELIFFPLILLSCQTVLLTGRRQLHLIPHAQLLSLSYQEYNQFSSTNKVISSGQQADLVQKVGQNIQGAVERYMRSQNNSGSLKGYQWEFRLFDNPAVNAWCMPGGKVGVYTGILPVTQDEAGLAVVLGHEIAHAIANHGNERMSHGLLVQFGGIALGEALSSKPDLTRQLAMAAFGVGSAVGVILPYSRLQETEADRLGLIFMAMAGYDPNVAVGFWTRMAEHSKGAPPAFLSTHPSDKTRIRGIKKHIPEAMNYANK